MNRGTKQTEAKPGSGPNGSAMTNITALKSTPTATLTFISLSETCLLTRFVPNLGFFLIDFGST